MIYVRTSPPGALAVSRDMLKAHLRLEDDDDTQDLLLDAYLAAAIEALDGRGGILNRCLVTQAWEAFAPGPLAIEPHHLDVRGLPGGVWGRFGFVLDLGPVQAEEPVAVSYLGPAGWTAVDPGVLRVMPGAGGRTLVTLTGAVAPAGWPLAPMTWRDRAPNPWKIAFSAGYGGPDDVPAPIKAAILLMATDLCENRDAKTVANLVANPTVDRLLAPYRAVGI